MLAAAARQERFQGCLLGLAIGDALGSHFEGLPPDFIRRRYDSPQSLLQTPPERPWYYTDDTQMTIGVAESLLQDGEIIQETLCQSFARNFVPSRGYGRGTRYILEAIREGQDYSHWTNELFPGGSFGNGAAMRVAPVGLMFHRDPQRVWEQARLSALPTHIHPLGIEGAQLIALAVALCMSDEPFHREEFFLALRQRCVTDEFQQRLELAQQVSSPDGLPKLGNGIAALDSVVTAIACFTLWPDSFPDVVSHAIVLGGDTDTIAAMAGAISGAQLGVAAIGQSLVNCLEDEHQGRSYLYQLANKLAAASTEAP